MIIAVCDTSSLIKLRTGGVVDCLGRIFDTVYIPTAVEAECIDPKTIKELQKPFFEKREVDRILPLGMGRGEREAISLAVELRTPYLIIDDERAIKKAIKQNLYPLTTRQILLIAKSTGQIQSVKSVLDTMKANGEGITEEIYQDTLRKAGEF